MLTGFFSVPRPIPVPAPIITVSKESQQLQLQENLGSCNIVNPPRRLIYNERGCSLMSLSPLCHSAVWEAWDSALIPMLNTYSTVHPETSLCFIASPTHSLVPVCLFPGKVGPGTCKKYLPPSLILFSPCTTCLLVPPGVSLWSPSRTTLYGTGLSHASSHPESTRSPLQDRTR